MKQCSRCRETKPLSEFNRRGKGHQAACRQCNSEYYRNYYLTNPKEKARILDKNREYRQQAQTLINKAKAVPCADCGIEYSPHVMQFDHLGNEEKLFNVSGGKSRYSLEKIKEEIAKCDVVCANCHAERTHKRRQTGVGYAGIAR